LAVATEANEPLQAAARMLDAWLLLWQGRLPEADAAIQRLKEQCRWLGQPRSLRVPLARISATCHAIRGEGGGVRAIGEELEAEALPATRNPNWAVEVPSMIGRLAAAADDWPTARRALAALEEARRTLPAPYFEPVIRMLGARLDLHEGRNAEALHSLRELTERPNATDPMGFGPSVRICLAVAELRTGSASAAWRVLAPVLASVSTEGVGGVLVTGPAMLGELTRHDWGAAATPEALDAFRHWAVLGEHWRRQREEARNTGEGAGPLLSARELQVVALLADGQCNKLIARTLDLSPHTIKRHVARILDRLGVSSRGEAAAWYHQRASH
jgi:LuxR family maltose regulon positive regulatory protein